MDFFVLLSSVAGIIGSIGQSNYSAGNTYQDSLARYRVSIGQKATSLDLGWMGDVGIIAENEDLARGKEVAADMACISETEFHALLAHCCAPTSKLHSLLQAQAIIGLVTPAQFRSKGLEPPDWTSTPLFSTLQHVGLEDSSSSAGNAGTSQGGATVDTVDYAAAFARSPSQEEAADVVTASLVSKLARAISVLPGEIDTTKPLHAYGVDSLLAVELRNWFAKTFKADVAVFEIMGKESVAAVGAAVAEKSVLKRES
jgi:acyl carrier protein